MSGERIQEARSIFYKNTWIIFHRIATEDIGFRASEPMQGKHEKLPKVSIIIPTLNSSSVLGKCLSSILVQKYPRHLMEIIIIDGGSQDSTLEIAKRSNVDKILFNKLKIAEAAKAIGVKEASGDLLVFIDSDNELDNPRWLLDAVKPFGDKEIFGCEALYWVYRREDKPINRYFALVGANDPLTLFAGNYCRYSYLTRKWTEIKLKCLEIHNGYMKVIFYPGITPVTGAGNGGVLRRNVLTYFNDRYFMDIDVVHELTTIGLTAYARIFHGTYHLFSRNLKEYLKKTLRRSFDFLYFSSRNLRTYPWKRYLRTGLPKFAFATLAMVPLLLQIRKGIKNINDIAWFYHIPICYMTFLIYLIARASSFIRHSPWSREKWSH